jgi:hypothetical protein
MAMAVVETVVLCFALKMEGEEKGSCVAVVSSASIYNETSRISGIVDLVDRDNPH